MTESSLALDTLPSQNSNSTVSDASTMVSEIAAKTQMKMFFLLNGIIPYADPASSLSRRSSRRSGIR